MKKYFILLLISPLLLSSSCKKDDLNISRKLKGLLNGAAWEAEGKYGSNLPHDLGVDLIFRVYNKHGELREELLIYKVPFKTGKHPISVTSNQIKDDLTGAVYYTFSHDGDVIDNRYRLFDPANNVVEITEANADENIIKGEVNATFLLDPSDAGDTEVDTIRVESGIFEIPVIN